MIKLIGLSDRLKVRLKCKACGQELTRAIGDLTVEELRSCPNKNCSAPAREWTAEEGAPENVMGEDLTDTSIKPALTTVVDYLTTVVLAIKDLSNRNPKPLQSAPRFEAGFTVDLVIEIEDPTPLGDAPKEK
jgi:hypothetical protein